MANYGPNERERDQRQMRRLRQRMRDNDNDWYPEPFGDPAEMPQPFGPFPRGSSPPERWAFLPEHTRYWLTGKSKEDLERLDDMLNTYTAQKDMLDDYNRAKTIGKFLRITVWVFGIIFGAVYTATKAGIDIFKSYKGG